MIDCLSNDKNTSFDKQVMVRVWNKAVHLTKNENLGLEVGQQLQLGAYNIVGSIIIYSDNIRVALDQAVYFHSLVNDDNSIGSIAWYEEKSSIVLEYKFTKAPFQLMPQIVECVITGFINFSKYTLPFTFKPIKVEFTHPPPKNIRPYEIFLIARWFLMRIGVPYHLSVKL